MGCRTVELYSSFTQTQHSVCSFNCVQRNLHWQLANTVELIL